MKFAMIGCGRMGRLHAERLRRDGRGAVVAVFDPDRTAAESLRSELAPTANVFSTFDDLLQQAGADAAIICTPTSLHFDQVRACRACGWAVLCEKPLADRREHLLALIDESRSGPPLSVAYQRRSWPIYRMLRDEVQSGRWGKVRAVTVLNCERWQQTIAGTWRNDPAINRGGFIGDAGSHKIDMIFYVTGLRATEVVACNQLCGSQVEITTSLTARLDRDALLTAQFIGHSQSYREDMHIHMEEADLLLRDWRIWLGRNNRIEPLPIANPDWQGLFGRSPIEHAELDQLGNPVSAFLDQLLTGATPVAPPDCALPVFDFTQAVLESGRNGHAVQIAT